MLKRANYPTKGSPMLAKRSHSFDLGLRREKLETFARRIIGPNANAETQIDLRRARYTRHRFLSDAVLIAGVLAV